MAFASFKTLRETASAYQVKMSSEPMPHSEPRPSRSLEEELDFNRNNMVLSSESAVDSFLIVPILRKVWEPYKDLLTLWSHEPLKGNELRKGVPDYFFTKRSSQLGLVQDKPYVFVVEATSKNDLDEGWAHCLAAMLAMQELNKPNKFPLLGAVSNGTTWSFGTLENQTLKQVMHDYTAGELDALLGALDALMELAKDRAYPM